MTSLIRTRGGWFDRWLVSDRQEELERHGPSAKGRRIIEELNKVYARTGVMRRFVGLLAGSIERARERSGQPVKVLDIGMRDGSLLHAIGDHGDRNGIAMQLHGVEFRKDLAAFARESCRSRGDRIRVHHDASRQLKGIEPAAFDIVCSTFMLHHLSPAEMAGMLVASDRAAAVSVVHLDLARSAFGVALIWLYWTLTGCFESRTDSVLSCRRALTVREATSMIQSADRQGRYVVRRLPPTYLLMARPPVVVE
jgi:hypothetical protein